MNIEEIKAREQADMNYIEGMCCDCANDTRGFCGDYSENEQCSLKRDDGSCWVKPEAPK